MKDNNAELCFTPIFKNKVLVNSQQDKEDQYKAIVENSVHAFFLSVMDGPVLETNFAATVMFGYTADEFKILKRWDFIDHTDPNLQLALQQREKIGFAMTEATGIKKNGERFPIEITSTIFMDINGESRISTMISDISLRKEAEAAMRLSNERYDLVVKATNDLVWDWDLVTGEIYRSGNSLFNVYGHRSNESIKNIQDWSNFIHPLDKEKIKSQIEHYIYSAAETVFNFEYRFRREDGTYAFINDKGYIIRDEEGKAIRMIGAAEDITERKQAALAIEESELRHKMFVQQSTEGIWRFQLDEGIHIDTPLEKMIDYCLRNSYIAECNDAFAKMYGYKKPEDIIGTPLHKMLPDLNPLNMGFLSKFFTNGFKVQEEISHEIDKEGNQLVFVNNMIGIIEGGYLKTTWGTQRDITVQYKAEQALLESENHLRTIVNADPECIKLLSKECIILEMNPAGLAMIDADSVDQVLGKNALSLVLPAYRESFKKLIEDVFDGKSGKLVFEVTGFKGKQLFMETHCVPLKNARGNIISALCVTRDITENKNAQALLLASEEQYKDLFNNNPSCIFIWDLDTLKYMEVNQASVDLYGYSREEFLQLTVLDIRPAAECAGFLKVVDEIRQDGDYNKTNTWRHINKKGENIFMEISSHIIMYNGTKAMLAIANNVTEKIKLENSLNSEREIRHQQITEAVITGQEKERTELGEELHDNINQILASTKLYMECALRDNNPRKDLIEESKSLLEKAMAEIRNLSKTLLPPSLGEISLLQALHELVDNITLVNQLAISIEDNNINEDEIGSKLKLTIFRIVQEQLNNVIKHAEAQKVIISIKKAEQQLIVSIKDNGLGFNTSLKKNGVGLRNISSRAGVNNGSVAIISQPGEGCELVITFGLHTEEERQVVNI